MKFLVVYWTLVNVYKNTAKIVYLLWMFMNVVLKHIGATLRRILNESWLPLGRNWGENCVFICLSGDVTRNLRRHIGFYGLEIWSQPRLDWSNDYPSQQLMRTVAFWRAPFSGKTISLHIFIISKYHTTNSPLRHFITDGENRITQTQRQIQKITLLNINGLVFTLVTWRMAAIVTHNDVFANINTMGGK